MSALFTLLTIREQTGQWIVPGIFPKEKSYAFSNKREALEYAVKRCNVYNDGREDKFQYPVLEGHSNVSNVIFGDKVSAKYDIRRNSHGYQIPLYNILTYWTKDERNFMWIADAFFNGYRIRVRPRNNDLDIQRYYRTEIPTEWHNTNIVQTMRDYSVPERLVDSPMGRLQPEPKNKANPFPSNAMSYSDFLKSLDVPPTQPTIRSNDYYATPGNLIGGQMASVGVGELANSFRITNADLTALSEQIRANVQRDQRNVPPVSGRIEGEVEIPSPYLYEPPRFRNTDYLGSIRDLRYTGNSMIVDDIENVNAVNGIETDLGSYLNPDQPEVEDNDEE